MRELSVDELHLVCGGDSGAASSGISNGNSGSQFLIQNFLAGSGVSLDFSMSPGFITGLEEVATGAGILVGVAAAPERAIPYAIIGGLSGGTFLGIGAFTH